MLGAEARQTSRALPYLSLTDTQSDPTAVDLSLSSDDSYVGEQKGIHSPDPHRRCLHEPIYKEDGLQLFEVCAHG